MTRLHVLTLASAATLGCSVVLDPDGLVFPEGDSTSGDDVIVIDDSGSLPEVQVTEDIAVGMDTPVDEDTSTPVETADSDAVAPIDGDVSGEDASDPAGVIRVGGGTLGCEVGYRIAPALPLVEPCAKTCASKKDGWPINLTFTGPGSASATWSVEATQGVVVTPQSGTGAALSTVLTFGADNCGSSDAVPDFTLLVNVKAGSVTTKANFDFDTTLDGSCPAISCR